MTPVVSLVYCFNSGSPQAQPLPTIPPTSSTRSRKTISLSLLFLSLSLLSLLLHSFIVLILIRTFSIKQRHNQQLMWGSSNLYSLYFVMDFIMDQFQVEVCVMIDQGQSRHYVQLFIRQHPPYG